MRLKGLAIFTLGTIIGAAVAHVVTKNKMEEILDEEIQSVKDTFKKRIEDKKESDKNVEKLLEKIEEENKVSEEEKKEYEQVIENSGYVNYSKYMSEEDEPKEDIKVEETDYSDVYVISDDEYGMDGYDAVTVTLYADGVFVDDIDDVIDAEEADCLFGMHNIKKAFEEYEATSVMIRNETQRIDYEICKDDWNYSDFNLDK